MSSYKEYIKEEARLLTELKSSLTSMQQVFPYDGQSKSTDSKTQMGTLLHRLIKQVDEYWQAKTFAMGIGRPPIERSEDKKKIYYARMVSYCQNMLLGVEYGHLEKEDSAIKKFYCAIVNLWNKFVDACDRLIQNVSWTKEQKSGSQRKKTFFKSCKLSVNENVSQEFKACRNLFEEAIEKLDLLKEEYQKTTDVQYRS